MLKQGSKSNPYSPAASANDPANWQLHLERLIVREVRTISTYIVMLSVSAVGSELIVDAKLVNSSAAQNVSSGCVYDLSECSHI
ncbi:hypothetical protein EON65_27595 [archaeon]|nr:MAG: hypothetical protein EON65_27595 [archaeon]